MESTNSFKLHEMRRMLEDGNLELKEEIRNTKNNVERLEHKLKRLEDPIRVQIDELEKNEKYEKDFKLDVMKSIRSYKQHVQKVFDHNEQNHVYLSWNMLQHVFVGNPFRELLL